MKGILTYEEELAVNPNLTTDINALIDQITLGKKFRLKKEELSFNINNLESQGILNTKKFLRNLFLNEAFFES